jgi:hypothetical protein
MKLFTGFHHFVWRYTPIVCVINVSCDSIQTVEFAVGKKRQQVLMYAEIQTFVRKLSLLTAALELVFIGDT